MYKINRFLFMKYVVTFFAFKAISLNPSTSLLLHFRPEIVVNEYHRHPRIIPGAYITGLEVNFSVR